MRGTTGCSARRRRIVGLSCETERAAGMSCMKERAARSSCCVVAVTALLLLLLLWCLYCCCVASVVAIVLLLREKSERGKRAGEKRVAFKFHSFIRCFTEKWGWRSDFEQKTEGGRVSGKKDFFNFIPLDRREREKTGEGIRGDNTQREASWELSFSFINNSANRIRGYI